MFNCSVKRLQVNGWLPAVARLKVAHTDKLTFAVEPRGNLSCFVNVRLLFTFFVGGVHTLYIRVFHVTGEAFDG